MKDINREPNRFNIAEKTFGYLLEQGFVYGSTKIEGNYVPCYKWKYIERLGEFAKRDIGVYILSNSEIVVKYGTIEPKSKKFESTGNESFEDTFDRVVCFKNEILCDTNPF